MSIWYQGMQHNNTMLDYTFMSSLAIKIWFESKQTKVGYLVTSIRVHIHDWVYNQLKRCVEQNIDTIVAIFNTLFSDSLVCIEEKSHPPFFLHFDKKIEW